MRCLHLRWHSLPRFLWCAQVKTTVTFVSPFWIEQTEVVFREIFSSPQNSGFPSKPRSTQDRPACRTGFWARFPSTGRVRNWQSYEKNICVFKGKSASRQNCFPRGEHKVHEVSVFDLFDSNVVLMSFRCNQSVWLYPGTSLYELQENQEARKHQIPPMGLNRWTGQCTILLHSSHHNFWHVPWKQQTTALWPVQLLPG